MTPVRAVPADADALGEMHVQAWRETYAGLVPDAVLAALDPARRATMWRGAIGEDRPVFLVRDGAAIVGFGEAGPQRDPALPYAHEIGALYVLRRAQRRGIGRALMDALARELVSRGAASVSLWVLDGNEPARRFYAARGGRVVQARQITRDIWTLDETAYAWDDISVLFEPASCCRESA